MSYNNCQFTWLKQKETLVSLAESLLKDSAFYDCQLCAEGHRFNVHRVILSCNSPVFSNILQEHNADLPVITLEGVSSAELGALIEFMYTGVTRISPNYLKNFFQVAKSLQLAGLNHYDNAQIDKIINENDNLKSQTEFQENYEAFSQKILKYLDQSGGSDSEVKDLTVLNASEENIFLDESSESVNIVSDSRIIYKEYGDFVKEEYNGAESVETQLIESEDGSQICDTVDSVKNNNSTTEASVVLDRFHNVFIKNEDKTCNNNEGAVYSLANLDDFVSEVKEGDQFIELQKNMKVTSEDENFVFLKLDNEAFDRLKESQTSKGKKILLKDDVHFYTKKCLKVINLHEKNLIIKRPRIQTLMENETKPSGDDKKIYICLKCGNKYSHRRTLLHHIHWICEQPATYSCSLCPYRGKRKFQLKSHMKHAHLLKMS